MEVEKLEDIKILKDRIKQYEKAFEYLDDAIYAQHRTMNHHNNTEYEKGQIDGLIQASKIVGSANKFLK